VDADLHPRGARRPLGPLASTPLTRMDTWLSDFGHGARMLRKYPAIYAVAILTLALGIAAATTMFSIVDAVLLRSLPYRDAGRLALVWDRNGDSARDYWLSPPEFADLQQMGTAFEATAALMDRHLTLTGRGDAEELQAVAVSPNLFEMVGATTAAGRTLRAGDEQRGGTLATVLSEPLAIRLFGSASAAVGQPITLDQFTWTVVGVLPRGFTIWPPSPVFPRRVDVWVALPGDLYATTTRNQNFLHALVRLKPDVDFAHASADVTRVSRIIAREHPESYARQRWQMTLVGLQDHLTHGVRAAVLIMFAAVGVLLLIACANVANLLLARAADRTREMAVRAVLGASRLRLLRQVLVESSVLAVASTIIGTVLAPWMVAAIVRLGPTDVPRLQDAAVDVRVLAFGAALTLVTTLLFGAAPALQLSHAHTVDRLKSGVRGSTDGPRARHTRAVFAIAQIALALVLTTSTGLLLKGLVRLGQTDIGFTPDAIATARLHLPQAKYADPAQRARFFDRLTEALAQRGEVSAAGAITQLPMSGAFLGSGFTVPPGQSREPVTDVPADLRGISGAYFDTLRIRLVAGRAFTTHDTADAPRDAIIDETLARRVWPHDDPIGRTLVWTRTGQRLEVVGVVAAVRHDGVAAPPRETVYRPYAQYASMAEMFIEARSGAGFDAARTAILDEVHRLDRDQPVADLARLDALVEDSLGQPRFNALLLAVFAGAALLLAAVGIYGVMSFSVTQRAPEIGVRLALGADPRAIVRMLVADAARLALGGVLAGLLLAVVLTQVLRTLLFGVSPWDPGVFAGVATLLATVSLAASYLPARRAARLEASSALRRS
jgi:putative ABC transport system permease protein